MADVGLAIFPTDYSIRPDEFAKGAEERGFASVFFPEHTHIPASRKTPFPMGGDLPKEYSHIHDLFIAMTAAAMTTTKIKIGAGVCLVTEHDPIHLAKQVASLDALSNGRVILGIGAGWNAEEMEDHGVPFKKRWRVTGDSDDLCPALFEALRGKSWKVAELRSDTRTLEAVFRELAESHDAAPIPRASIAPSKGGPEVRA